MLDVVVHDVHLVSPDGSVPEAVHMSLEGAREALLYYVGSDVQILQKPYAQTVNYFLLIRPQLTKLTFNFG